MSHLRSVRLKRAQTEEEQTFPFSVAVIRHLAPLDISPTVTFLVGENGSGKSTLLEGIAAAVGMPAIASESVDRDTTLEAQRSLGDASR
jgi:predicted ATPase